MWCILIMIHVLNCLRHFYWSPGPALPQGIKYPCTHNINSSHIFIVGQSLSNGISTLAYLFDMDSAKWTDLSTDIACQHEKHFYKYSCAYLGPENHALFTVNSCTGVIDLKSFIWAEFPLSTRNGIAFNVDLLQNVVVYIAPEENNEHSLSRVFLVSYTTNHQ